MFQLIGNFSPVGGWGEHSANVEWHCVGMVLCVYAEGCVSTRRHMYAPVQLQSRGNTSKRQITMKARLRVDISGTYLFR